MLKQRLSSLAVLIFKGIFFLEFDYSELRTIISSLDDFRVSYPDGGCSKLKILQEEDECTFVEKLNSFKGINSGMGELYDTWERVKLLHAKREERS
jgi:hypothetical protein